MNEDSIDWSELLNSLRKSASVKAGAVIFGQAQVAYFDTLKEHMSEEDAFNMTAHTTECVIKGISMAAGPLAEALLKASFLWERAAAAGMMSDKEMPGGN